MKLLALSREEINHNITHRSYGAVGRRMKLILSIDGNRHTFTPENLMEVEALRAIAMNSLSEVEKFKKGGVWVSGQEVRYYLAPPHTNDVLVASGIGAEVAERLSQAYNIRNIKIKEEQPYKIHKADIPLNGVYTPRPIQREVIDFIKKETGRTTRLVGAAPGKGKTLMAIFAVAELGHKVLVIVRSAYMEKWVEDFRKYTNPNEVKIRVIAGSKSLNSFFRDVCSGTEDSSVVIMSNATINVYISLWESDSFDKPFAEKYEGDVTPDTLFSKGGFGVLLIDEAHQDAVFNHNLVSLCNADKVIALSGTYIGKSAFNKRMKNLLFPATDRHFADGIKAYMNIRGVGYQLAEPGKAKISRFGSTMYSHTAYESWILGYPVRRKNYFTMIKKVLEVGYIADYVKGDKAAIFVSTIEMASQLTEYLREEYPDDAYSIEKYTGGDDYQQCCLDPDIRVTTIGAMGAAVDISRRGEDGKEMPALTFTFMTVVITSEEANIQVLNRTREMANRPVWFYYAFANNIPKHVITHHKKLALFKPYAAYHGEAKYPTNI
jgi:superfamily II DNA or RNA helicase